MPIVAHLVKLRPTHTCSHTCAQKADKPLDDILPFGSRKLSEAEQLQHCEELRDSSTAWRQLLDEHGPRQTVAYAERMEGRAGVASLLPASDVAHEAFRLR